MNTYDIVRTEVRQLAASKSLNELRLVRAILREVIAERTIRAAQQRKPVATVVGNGTWSSMRLVTE